MTNAVALLGLLNPRLGARYTDTARIPFRTIAAVLLVQFNDFECTNPAASPDESNVMIANGAASLRLSARTTPVFGQTQHRSTLAAANIPFPTEHELTATSEKHVPTHEFLKWAAEKVHALNKGNRVVIIGHPHHLRRIETLARYYGLDPIFPAVCADVPYDPRNRPGAQRWARSPWLYIPWDYIVGRPGTIALWMFGKL